jgi:hypothetical protein
MFSFRSTRAAKGRFSTGSADPATGTPNWRRAEELRRAAGPLLVAGTPVQDLSFRAKYLFVEAMLVAGVHQGLDDSLGVPTDGRWGL